MLVFLLNVFLFFGVQAQTHRVTLNVKETSLEQVIKELEKQTGLQFFYSQDKIEKITGLSLQAKQEDFKTILDRLLKHTPLTFTVMDDVVVIKDREKTASPLQSAIREIKGVVTDVNLLTGKLKVRLDKSPDSPPAEMHRKDVKVIRDNKIRVDKNEKEKLSKLEE